ncbi:MAG: tetratricopeptide repeat protein [Thermomicrobiales bacterium]
MSFNSLLRRYRLAAGLTQEELAERAGVSARGVQDLERGIRQAPRLETVRLLADALALPADARAALIAAARPGVASTPISTPSPIISVLRLPTPPTSLLGRESEVARICALLRDPECSNHVRLVTLTGPGGVGKTRLALAVASELAGDPASRAAWIDLGAVQDASVVAAAIGRGIGMTADADRELLLRTLADQTLLLVLDNCEHLLSAMPLVADLLAACPGLSVLATSRTRLRLRGEREVVVEPLSLPAASSPVAPSLSALAATPAMRLFIERAAEVQPGFTLTESNVAEIEGICRRLEGLPLALELAAARAKFLSPAALLARLEHRLPILSGGARDLPPRQQTMQDTIAWSHDLMSADEQALFRRLAVFVGGFTLDAVPPVSPAAAALDLLAALIDQSVVRAVPATAGETRFTMLETVREYAAKRLATSGEEAEVRRAHATFFVDLAERARPELRGPDQEQWLERLEADHDNLRTALNWTLAYDARLGLRLAAALGLFWRMHGHPREGLSWLARALALDSEEITSGRAIAQEEAGRLAHDLDDPNQAERFYAAALASWCTLKDRSGEARLLDDLGNIAHDRGDFIRAVTLHQDALSLAREAGDLRAAGRALNNLGMTALYQGQDNDALRHYAAALAIMQDLGDAFAINVIRNNLGIVQIRREEWETAAATFEACLKGCRDLGDQRGIGSALVNLAVIRHQQGDASLAEALYERARHMFVELGDDRAEAAALEGLALIALVRGDTSRAADLLGASLALAHRIDDKLKIAEGLESLAAVACAHGVMERAARLVGAASTIRTTIAAPIAAHRRADHEQTVTNIRTALGEDRFAAAEAFGASLTLDAAVDDASAIAAAMAEAAI